MSKAGQPGGPNRTALMQRELAAYTAKNSPARRVRAAMPQELQDAALLLLHDFLLADSAPVDTERSLVPRNIRDAQATVAMLKAELPAAFIRDIEFFITCTVHRNDGSLMRLEDSGAEMFPNNAKDAQRWAGAGGLVRTLQASAVFYARQKALGKPGAKPSTGDRELLMNQLKVLAQKRRERDSG